jgi:hypothetical protein
MDHTDAAELGEGDRQTRLRTAIADETIGTLSRIVRVRRDETSTCAGCTAERAGSSSTSSNVSASGMSWSGMAVDLRTEGGLEGSFDPGGCADRADPATLRRRVQRDFLVRHGEL